jgi:nicotinamidase-related amidase
VQTDPGVPDAALPGPLAADHIVGPVDVASAHVILATGPGMRTGATAPADLRLINRATRTESNMPAVKRIVPEHCCAVIIDLQGYFLSQIGPRIRSSIKANTTNLVRLLGAFGIPIVATLERPVDFKGAIPKEIAKHLSAKAKIFEKDFFDLAKDKKIKRSLASLKRSQVIVSGCETDVCVMQSCLGLVELGYEVYVMEELIFSSTRNVEAALARMREVGCVFLTYKMLYYELIESVGGPDHRFEIFGQLPDDLPDSAV